MPVLTQKSIPEPVLHANAALDLLRAEDPGLAESLQKILPSFALKLAKIANIEITPEILLIEARKGYDHIKAPPHRENLGPKVLRYRDIIPQKPPSSYQQESDQRSARWRECNDRLFKEGKEGTLESLKQILCGQDLHDGTHDLHGYDRPGNRLYYIACGLLEREPAPWRLFGKKDAGWIFEKLVKHACENLSHGFKETSRYYKAEEPKEAYTREKLLNDIHAHGYSNPEFLDFLYKTCPDVCSPQKTIIDFPHRLSGAQTWFLMEKYNIHPSEVYESLNSYFTSSDHGSKHDLHRNIFLKYNYNFFDKSLQHLYGYDSRNYHLMSERWENTAQVVAPPHLYKENPKFYRKECLDAVAQILALEGYEIGRQQNTRYSFAAAALFGTEQRVLEYLQKWGDKDAKQPLHDIIQHIRIPAEGDPDLDSWGNAVMELGPNMAKLVKFSDKIPIPKKADPGSGLHWSYSKTRAEIATFAFKKGAENPALAAICVKHAVEEAVFEKALTLSFNLPAKKNIPDIQIDGEKFGMPGVKFYRLPVNDLRGFFLGEEVDCCQSVGGVGAACAIHGMTSENSGFYVVEDAKGIIRGEIWAWRGTKGELCFDSLETLGKNITAEQWSAILHAYAEELTKNTRKHDVTKLTIGLGGDTPKSLRNSFIRLTYEDVPQPRDYKGYRDSSTLEPENKPIVVRQALVWPLMSDVKARR